MKPDDTSDTIPSLVLQHIEIFVCPVCDAGLDVSADRQEMRYTGCGLAFGCEHGIPLLFWPNEPTPRMDVTQDVKAFYEENPFPSYEDFDSPWSLREKAQRGFLPGYYTNWFSLAIVRQAVSKTALGRVNEHILEGANR